MAIGADSGRRAPAFVSGPGRAGEDRSELGSVVSGIPPPVCEQSTCTSSSIKWRNNRPSKRRWSSGWQATTCCAIQALRRGACTKSSSRRLTTSAADLRLGPMGCCILDLATAARSAIPTAMARTRASPRLDAPHRRRSTGDGKPYAIPADNPFLQAHKRDQSILPETWAIGLREPWRFSFDPKTGDLWVGDVGQDKFEEVCRVAAGENHGWNVYEGYEPFSDEYRREGEKFSFPCSPIRTASACR